MEHSIFDLFKQVGIREMEIARLLKQGVAYEELISKLRYENKKANTRRNTKTVLLCVLGLYFVIHQILGM